MWIYLPTSCLSAPAAQASTLDSESLARRLEPSATWKGKLLPPRSWRRVFKTAPWTKLLFGRTFEHLTASRGAASWIASLRATRANRFPSRANGKARKTLGICGPKSRASSASVNRNGCFSKTSAATCDWDFAKSPKSYEVCVTALRRDSLQRRKSARRTAENDYSRWPTARSEDAESCGNHPNAADSLTGTARMWKTPHGLTNNADGGGGEFHKQATRWQTPATDSFRSRGGDRKDEPGLDQQSRCWRTPDAPTTGGIRTRRSTSRGDGHQVVLAEQAAIWPTPNANPAPRGANFTKSDSHYKPHDLTTAANQWPTPVANDHKSAVTGAVGKQNARPLREAVSSFRRDLRTSKLGANSSPSTRKLNPLFVEMLMGLPLGWTDCAPLATASFRSWRRTHTAAFEGFSMSERLAA